MTGREVESNENLRASLPNLAIVGAGGHGKVVAEAAMASASFKLVGFLDDNALSHGTNLLDFPILGKTNSWREQNVPFLVAGVGDNKTRRDIVLREAARGANWISIIHPSATIARSAALGAGTVVLAGAIINAEANVRENSIINTGAIVEHDCNIGPHVHIAPRCCLAGNVTVGEGTFLGAGSIILPGVKIGDWCTIGAGAVVNKNVESQRTVVGVPARILR